MSQPDEAHKQTMMACRLRKKAQRYADKNLRAFAGEYDMEQMFRSDLRMLNRTADLVQAGEFRRAMAVAEQMDTACRDEIPTSVWIYIAENARKTGAI